MPHLSPAPGHDALFGIVTRQHPIEGSKAMNPSPTQTQAQIVDRSSVRPAAPPRDKGPSDPLAAAEKNLPRWLGLFVGLWCMVGTVSVLHWTAKPQTQTRADAPSSSSSPTWLPRTGSFCARSRSARSTRGRAWLSSIVSWRSTRKSSASWVRKAQLICQLRESQRGWPIRSGRPTKPSPGRRSLHPSRDER